MADTPQLSSFAWFSPNETIGTRRLASVAGYLNAHLRDPEDFCFTLLSCGVLNVADVEEVRSQVFTRGVARGRECLLEKVLYLKDNDLVESFEEALEKEQPEVAKGMREHRQKHLGRWERMSVASQDSGYSSQLHPPSTEGKC